jgi:hypothetical protein
MRAPALRMFMTSVGNLARTRALAQSSFSAVLLTLGLVTIFLGCGGGANSQGITHQTPSFTLASSPSTVVLQQAATGAISVTVTPTGGFSSSVNLAASGLPSGVTATFNPASTTSSSTLTFTISGSAATGSSTITVTGTSGNLAPTTSVNLTVLVAPPAGSLPQSFFALNNVDPTDDPTVDGMLYGAVGHPIRLAWPYIETARGTFDFSFYDEYAAIAPREGPNGVVAVMDLTLGMTPSWAISDQSTCRTLPDPGGPTITGCQAPPDNIQDWKDFITALVQHYNGSTPATPYIKYYEIWNEWDVNDAQNGFWDGPISSLVGLQTAACSIIHATLGNTFSLVLTPSTVGPATTPNDQAPQDLTSYFNAGGNNCPGSANNLIDGVSFHGNLGVMTLSPYPLPGEGCTQSGCNGTILQIANSYREVMNLNGLQSTPLLDTEGGFESANITDADQRAAWLAQFYVLQGGLLNSDQLQWVSWFTWGAPGVAGNIENANSTPDEAGVAYNQVFNWLFGRFPAACTQAGTVWTCPLTGSSSYQAIVTWDDSQTCNNGACTTSTQTAPSWAVKTSDLAGNTTSITGGSQISVGLKPIIVENQ